MEELEKCKEKLISGAAYLLSVIYDDIGEDEIHKHFIRLLKQSLWGNQYDLARPVVASASEIQYADSGEEYDAFILVDDSELVWETMKVKREDRNIVNIVNDNAGYELFCDFCLADFMLSFGLADSISFHIKAMPWFTCDTIFADFVHLMNFMAESHESLLMNLHDRWQGYVYDGVLVIKDERFWTLPHPYHEMSDIDLSLYAQLQHSKLIIFKGDVNYRKLLAETKHMPTESFFNALMGFHPANLVSLRTVKCEIICGITEEQAENLFAEDPNWMLAGKYAVIQFDGK